MYKYKHNHCDVHLKECHIPSSTIHNRQKVEATQVSTDEWIDKQNVVYTYNPIMCYNRDKTWGH